MKTDYEIAEEMFNSGCFSEAFNAFEEITLSNSHSIEDKSDSFNMMGVIILFDTTIESNDESGLEFFKKSLNLNVLNIGAHFNIIEGFGLSFNNHKNIEMLDFSIQKLHEINYVFSDEEREMINDKIKLKELMKSCI